MQLIQLTFLFSPLWEKNVQGVVLRLRFANIHATCESLVWVRGFFCVYKSNERVVVMEDKTSVDSAVMASLLA